jgi:hypothetical protein
MSQTIQIPSLTTAERNALVSVKDGMMIFNTDVQLNQSWDGAAWIDVGGGGGSATLQTAYDTGNGKIQLDNSGLKPVFIESDSLGVPPQLKFEQLQIPAGLQATFAISAVSKNDLNNPITYNQMVATVASLTAGNDTIKWLQQLQA